MKDFNKVIKYATIDIGSNAIRLLISNIYINNSEHFSTKNSLVRVPIRLGQDAFKNGKISKKNIQRLLDSMKSFKLLMKVHDVNKYLAYATSALRSSSNGKKIIDLVEMPSMAEGKKNKKQVNGAQIYYEISSRIKDIKKEDIKVIIEQVSAMPGQGVTSMFNFGQSFGILKGICSAMQLPMYFVRPAKWKKYFNLINSEKDASRTKAIEVFPYFSSELSRKKDSNKADAILIASFYYETYKLEE